MKAIVVHRGATDHYQVAPALDESGALDTLVTDAYWPGEISSVRAAGRMLPASARRAVAARYAPGSFTWSPFRSKVAAVVERDVGRAPHAAAG